MDEERDGNGPRRLSHATSEWKARKMQMAGCLTRHIHEPEIWLLLMVRKSKTRQLNWE
jgi:hypothetical protein